MTLMRRLVECSVIALLLILANSITDSLTKDDVQAYIEDVIAEFQVKLRRAAHAEKRRVKREVTMEDFKRNLPQSYESQVLNITPWLSIPSVHPVEIEPFVINNEQYLAVVNFKNEHNKYDALSAVYKLATNGSFTKVQQFATSGGIDFEYIEFGIEKYAIFLDYFGRNFYGSPTYERWFKVNQYLPYENFAKPFQFKTKVRALGATSVKVFQREHSYFFLTANSFYEIGNQHHVKSTMHLKAPYGYFMIQEFDTHGAQDVEVIVIDDTRYILFVNHQDNTGSVDIYSFVYREKKKHELTKEDNYAPFGLYQRILTHGGRDFEYFQYQNKQYLVAINEYTQVRVFDSKESDDVVFKDYEVDSIIYWWTGKLWVEWQRIPTQGGRKATFFLSDYGDPMLVICNSKSQAVIYTHDPLKEIFKPTEVQGLSPFPNRPDFIPDVRSVSAFKINNETYLAVANYNLSARSGYNVFKVSFHKSQMPKLDPTIPEIVIKLIADMKRELERVKNTLTKMLLEVTDTVLTRSTPQNLTTLKLMKSQISELKTGSLLYRKEVSVNPVHEMAEQAVLIKRKILEQEKVLKDIQQQFQDIVLVDTPDVVTAKKTFKQQVSVDGGIVAKKLNVGGLVDGVDAVTLNETVFKTNVDQEVTGTFVFHNKTIFVKNVNLDGKVNDVYTTDMMTVSTPQAITSTVSFKDNVTWNNDVMFNNFTLNGIKLSTVVTKSTAQTISGSNTYSSVNFSDIVVDGLVQDVNVTDFHSNKVSLFGADVLQRDVMFENGFYSSSDVNVTVAVDGVNLDAFASDLKMTGENEVIAGNKTFKSIKVLGSAAIQQINGNNMDKIATVSNDNTFTMPVVFTENLKFNSHIFTNSTVNGINIHEQVVFNHSNAQVYGNKTFTNTVHVSSNLSLKATGTGLALEELAHSAVLKDQKTPVTGSKTFVNGITIDSLSVDLINNIDMKIIQHDLLSILCNTTWTDRLNFDTIKVTSDTKVSGTVNGYHIPEEFVLLGENQVITGLKMFLQNVTFKNLAYSSGSTVNDASFHDFFATAVFKYVPQDIHANINFENSVFFTKNSNITGLLNTTSVLQLGTVTGEQNFTGRITLTTKTTMEDSVSTRIVDVTTNVDGIDISEMERHTVYKDRNQTINGSIVFVAGIDCKQNLSVAGLINGVNLTELYDNSVRVSKNQHIQMQQTFASSTEFRKELITSGTVNNVNITELLFTCLKKHETQTIKGDLVFHESLNSTEHLNTQDTSLVNDVNIRGFLDSTVLLDENHRILINGTLTYSRLQVEHITTATFNRVNISNVLLKSGNYVITGQATFIDISSGPLEVNTVNALNISDIKQHALTIASSQNVTGKYTFLKDVHVHGSVLSVKINNVNVKKFSEDAVNRFTNDTIYGNKHFHIVSIGNLATSKLISGVNITTVLSDVLLPYGPQEVCHRKVYQSTMTVTKNATLFDIQNNGFINHVNLTEFEQNIVNLKKPETLSGNYTFDEVVAGNVYVDEINGLDIGNGFLLTNGNQTMVPPITIGSIASREDLHVHQFIDGIDLKSLNSDSISYNEDIVVNGNLEFVRATTTEINMAPNATINNVRPADLVSRTEDTSLNDVKVFGKIITDTIISESAMVNGVNLSSLVQQSLNESRALQQLLRDQNFLKNLTILGNVTVEGLMNGQIVSMSHNYAPDVSSTIKSELQSLNSSAHILCPKITSLLPVTGFSSKLFGIEKVYEVILPSPTLGAFDSTIIKLVHYISIARAKDSGCGVAYIMECFLFPHCDVLQTIETNAHTLEFFEHNETPALMVDHYDEGVNISSSCPKSPEIYIWSGEDGKFKPSQTVNEELMESNDAPVVKSKILLAKFFNKQLKKQLNTEMKDDVKLFKHQEGDSSVDYILHTGEDDEGDYVDLYMVNGTTIGSMKKQQRLIINSNRKKHIYVGKLGNKNILSVSSSLGNDMKLYLFNEKKREFEFYQDLKQSATSVKIEKVKKNEFIFFASPDTGFGLCSWLGVSGFEECKSTFVTDTTDVETIFTDIDAFTIIGRRDTLVIYHIIFDGSSTSYAGSVC